MNSALKSILHTIATVVALWLPTIASSSHGLDITVGGLIALILNWIISHTIPTLNGASAHQNSTL